MDFDTTLEKGFRLLRKKQTKNLGLFIIVTLNTGLRPKQNLELTFQDLRKRNLTTDQRTIKINPTIRKALKYFKDCADTQHCFISQKGSVYEVQSINRQLKKVLDNKEASTQLLRKCFGRRVWIKNGKSVLALAYLMDLFGHSKLTVTRSFLGIKASEVDDIFLNL